MLQPIADSVTQNLKIIFFQNLSILYRAYQDSYGIDYQYMLLHDTNRKFYWQNPGTLTEFGRTAVERISVTPQFVITLLPRDRFRSLIPFPFFCFSFHFFLSFLSFRPPLFSFLSFFPPLSLFSFLPFFWWGVESFWLIPSFFLLGEETFERLPA